MRTQVRPEQLEPRASALERGRAYLRKDAAGVLLVCLAGGLLMAFFLSPYLRRGLRMPFGFDAARYLDQTNLVARYGLSGSTALHLPPPSRLLSGRAGFFVTVLTLSRLFGTDTFKFAAIVPAVSGVALALGAGAFLSYVRRRGPWELSAIAAIVGTSGVVVRLMGGTYTDNLVAGAALMAAFVPLWSFLSRGRGFLATIILLAAGGLAHPQFLGIVIGVIGIVAVLSLPSSWRAWKTEGRPVASTASGRLGLVMIATVALVATLLVPSLGSGVSQPVIPSHATLLQKFRVDIPLYRFPITLPLAVLGAMALFVEAHGVRRRRPSEPPRAESETLAPGLDRSPRPESSPALFLFLWTAAWVGITAVVVLGLYLGRRWPAHRFLAFLLPFPILEGIGLLWVGRSVGQRAFRAAGASLVLVGVFALAYLGYRSAGATWVPFLDVGRVQDAATSAEYMDSIHLPETRPVVFIITDPGRDPRETIPLEEHMVRTVLPATRIPHAYFYVGRPQDYLQRRATFLPGDTRDFNAISARSWDVVQEVLPQRPVAFLLYAYNSYEFRRVSAEHPNWQVAPRVLVMEGPRTTRIPLPPYPSAPHGIAQNAFFGIGALVVLTLIGLGWGLALLPSDLAPTGHLALAPALGIGFLLLAGTALDAIGLRLGGNAGVLAGPVIGGLGWIAALSALRLHRAER
jgi:hypothetical protein